MSSLRAFLPSLLLSSFVLAGCNPPPTANSLSGEPTEASSLRAEMPRETQLESSSELSQTEPQLEGENLQRESLEEQGIEHETTETLAFYTIDHYDAARDPAKDLAETLVRAQAEDKRILLQVGGEWCGWCKLMSKFIESNAAVRERMDQRFLLMKVTWMPDQKNEEFLSQYPSIKGYPHLFVLDKEGKLLHSQDTAELEEGKGYNETKFQQFLDKWAEKQ